MNKMSTKKSPKVMFPVPQLPPREPRKVQNSLLNYHQLTFPQHTQRNISTYYPQTLCHP